MSQAGISGNGGGGGGGNIVTIDGDVGSITGNTVTIYADNAAVNCGSSVEFVNSGTVSTLNVTDQIQNVIIGQGAGNLGISGQGNTALGFESLQSITTCTKNTAIGRFALQSMTGGSGGNTAIGEFSLQALSMGQFNVAVGQATGTASTPGFGITTGSFNVLMGVFGGNSYRSSESSNVLIQNAGVLGDNNVIRIGTQGNGSGQQDICYVAGIVGNTVSNANFVTIDTTTGQLGVVANAGTNWSVVTSATNPKTLVANNGYITKGAGVVNFILPAAAAIGDTFKIVGYGNLWTIAQNAGQSIRVGSVVSTVGVGGSVSASMVTDCLDIICVTANTEFFCNVVQGNPIIV